VTKDEKLGKVVRDFSMLPDDKQDYVLGILQALVFAGDGWEETIPVKTLDEGVEASTYESMGVG